MTSAGEFEKIPRESIISYVLRVFYGGKHGFTILTVLCDVGSEEKCYELPNVSFERTLD